MPRLVCHFNRIQTNIKKLVDGFQRSCDRQVILEFDRDALIGERFEN
jgi:hypothetical protein